MTSDRETVGSVDPDPFVAALECAAHDDEPFTDADQAASEEGWREHQRGESASVVDSRRLITARIDSDTRSDD